MELFATGTEQTIVDVLEDRDQRVAEQKLLLQENPDESLLVVKLNIPGPIKNNELLHQLFTTGMQRFLQRLGQYEVVLKWNKLAGNTWFILSPLSSIEVKMLAIEFEDEDELGRFFDIDVLVNGEDGALSRSNLGLPSRTCFICGKLAKECSRSRNHSVRQLQLFIEKKYQMVRGENVDD